MKITNIHIKTQTDGKLILAFDVSKEKLDCYGEYSGGIIEDSFENNTNKIEQKLLVYCGLTESIGLGDLRVLCESTGIYHRIRQLADW